WACARKGRDISLPPDGRGRGPGGKESFRGAEGPLPGVRRLLHRPVEFEITGRAQGSHDGQIEGSSAVRDRRPKSHRDHPQGWDQIPFGQWGMAYGPLLRHRTPDALLYGR